MRDFELEKPYPVFTPEAEENTQLQEPDLVDVDSLYKAQTRKNFWDQTGGAMLSGAAQRYGSKLSDPDRYKIFVGQAAQFAAELLPAIKKNETVDHLIDKAVEHWGSDSVKEQYALLGDFGGDGLINKWNDWGTKLVEESRKDLAAAYETPNSKLEKFFTDVGGGFYSMGEAILLQTATGPLGVYAYFGAMETFDKNEELKKAGVPVNERLVGSIISGIINGGIEAASTFLLLKGFEGTWLKRGMKSAILEGIEEFDQDMASDLISAIYGVAPTNDKGEPLTPLEIFGSWLYSGVIGTIVGGPTGVVVAKEQRDHMAKLMEMNGIQDSKKKADRILGLATEDTINSLQDKLIKGAKNKRDLLEKAFNDQPLTPQEFEQLNRLYEAMGLDKAQLPRDIEKRSQEIRFQRAKDYFKLNAYTDKGGVYQLNLIEVNEDLRNQGVGQNVLITDLAGSGAKYMNTTALSSGGKALMARLEADGFIEKVPQEEQFAAMKRGQPTGTYRVIQPRIERHMAERRLPVQEQAAFKRWFKDSKVKDANGNPQVVYHGTEKDFSSFATGPLGSHFGTAEQASVRLAGGRQGMNFLEGARVIPVYLSLQNPYYLGADIGDFNDLDTLKEYFGPANHEVFTKEEIDKMEILDDLKQGLIDKGYDGIIYENQFEGDGESYIAFHPAQVKSVFNYGTYGQKENIRFQEAAPAVDTDMFEAPFKDKSNIPLHNAKVEVFNILAKPGGFLDMDALWQLEKVIRGSDIDYYLRKVGENRTWEEIWASHDGDTELDTPNIPTDVFEIAKLAKGVTNNLKEAGYILPDGTLLDFSGKRVGGQPGERAEDHRQLGFGFREDAGLHPNQSGSADMIAFQKHGAVRIDGNSGLIDTETMPTPIQMQIIKRILENNNGGWLDVADGKRHWSGEIHDPKRAYGMIKRFFNGDDLGGTMRYQEVDPLGFKSKLYDVINEKMPNRASGQQIMGMIRGIVKKDEIEYSGIAAFVEGKDSIEKTEMLEFIGGQESSFEEDMGSIEKGQEPEENSREVWRVYGHGDMLETFDDESDAEQFMEEAIDEDVENYEPEIDEDELLEKARQMAIEEIDKDDYFMESEAEEAARESIDREDYDTDKEYEDAVEEQIQEYKDNDKYLDEDGYQQAIDDAADTNFDDLKDKAIDNAREQYRRDVESEYYVDIDHEIDEDAEEYPGVKFADEDWRFLGEEEYREYTLKLPTATFNRGLHFRLLEEKMTLQSENERIKAENPDAVSRTVLKNVNRIEEIDKQLIHLKPGKYYRGHYPGPNVLVHFRVTTRTVKINGQDKKMFFVEEVQSDWHQQGHRLGYVKPGEGVSEEEVQNKRDAAYGALERNDHLGFNSGRDAIAQVDQEMGMILYAGQAEKPAKKVMDKILRSWEWNSEEDIKKMIDYYWARMQQKRIEEGIPDVPWKDSWDQLAMKRVLTIAAREGYDVVGWTTGEQQIDRWNSGLRSRVTQIKLRPMADNKVRMEAKTVDGKNIETLFINHHGFWITQDRIGGHHRGVNEVVGKDIWDKFMNGEGLKPEPSVQETGVTTMVGVYEGDDLAISGSLHKMVYNVRIPGFLKEYVDQEIKHVKIAVTDEEGRIVTQNTMNDEQYAALMKQKTEAEDTRDATYEAYKAQKELLREAGKDVNFSKADDPDQVAAEKIYHAWSESVKDYERISDLARKPRGNKPFGVLNANEERVAEFDTYDEASNWMLNNMEKIQKSETVPYIEVTPKVKELVSEGQYRFQAASSDGKDLSPAQIEAANEIRKILGPNFIVDMVDVLYTYEGKLAAGAYDIHNKFIKISKDVRSDTAAHEAFHAIFWQGTSETKRRQLLNEVIRLKGFQGEKADVQAEEFLADEFTKMWMDAKHETGSARLTRVIREWIALIRSWITKKDEISAYLIEKRRAAAKGGIILNAELETEISSQQQAEEIIDREAENMAEKTGQNKQSIKERMVGATEERMFEFTDRAERMALIKERLNELKRIKKEWKNKIRPYEGDKLKEEYMALPAYFRSNKGAYTLDEAAQEAGFVGDMEFRDYLIGLDQDISSAENELSGLREQQKEGSYKTTLNQIKERLKALQSGERIGRIEQKKETRAVQRELRDAIVNSPLPKGEKERFLRRIPRIMTEKNLEAKLPEIIKEMAEVYNRVVERTARAKAETVITKKRKQPENILDVEYQKKIDAVQQKLGGTKTAMRKSIKQMDTQELIALANEIAEAVEKGRKVFRTKKDATKMAQEIMFGALIKETGGKKLGEYATAEYRKALKSKRLHKYAWGSVRPIRMMRLLFGQEGERLLYDSVDHHETAKLEVLMRRHNKVKDAYKKYGIKKLTLAKVITIGDKSLNINNILGIYVHSKNEDAWKAVLAGNFKKTWERDPKAADRQATEFVQYVHKNYKEYIKFADELQKIVSERTNRLEEVMEKYFNVPFERVAHYFPMFRDTTFGNNDSLLDNEKNLALSIVAEQAARSNKFNYAAVEKAFTIPRSMIELQNQQPISLDLIGITTRAIQNQEHLIAYAPLQKMFNAIKAHRPLKEAVLANHGIDAWNEFENYLSRQINPNVTYSKVNNVHRLVSLVRQAVGTAMLGFNMVTAAKQIPSMFFALRFTTIPRLIQSAMRMPFDKNLRQRVLDLDPTLKHRIISRDLDEWLSSDSKLYENELVMRLALAQDTIGKAAFSWILNMDKFAVMVVYDSVYNHARQTMSETEARDLAHKAVIETQPQGGMKDLPGLYATNDEFLRMAIMFSNQLNQIMNMVFIDAQMDWKAGDRGRAITTVSSVMFTSFLIYLASSGGNLPDSDDEDAWKQWFDALFGSVVSSFPIFGNYIMAGVRGFKPSTNPIDSAVEQINRQAARWNDNKAEATLEILSNVAILGGVRLPYAQPRRTLKGIIDLYNGDTNDIRRLVWSKYALGED